MNMLKSHIGVEISKELVEMDYYILRNTHIPCLLRNGIVTQKDDIGK